MRTAALQFTTTRNSTSITDLISGIPALSRGDLIERWSEHYGSVPSKSISTRLLAYAVAYATQVEHHGGLSTRSKRELMRLAGAVGALHECQPSGDNPVSTRRKKSGGPGNALRRGTRLVREWNGKSHVVEVVATGFVWQGKSYRSLSAIATCITGNRWSGPRFFGLT